MTKPEGQSPNCSHKPDPCSYMCGCYCNGCTVERVVEERDRAHAALRGIDAALKRHVPHMPGNTRGWALAEDVRSMLATSGLALQ